jgi:hypothetical protein
VVPPAAADVVDSRSDATGDVAFPEIDIVDWVIEVPPGAPFEAPDEPGTWIGVRLGFAGEFPPPDDFAFWYASVSAFFTTTDSPNEEVHVGATHSEESGVASPDTTDCFSGPCPTGITPFSAVTPEGALLLVVCIPVPPD